MDFFQVNFQFISILLEEYENNTVFYFFETFIHSLSSKAFTRGDEHSLKLGTEHRFGSLDAENSRKGGSGGRTRTRAYEC